ncbi:MAG TPA: peptidylprolyl isomerase [Gammaproteobacteria bacterium]|nr:peptidylprolyl isomerase [Gammaproteobacteria bacterium]
MEIATNKVVTFHYTVTDTEGSFSESSEGGDPVAYLHGRGHIVPGLESELKGKQAGDEVHVSVPPEEAYGSRDPAAVQRVPIKHLVRPGRLEPGKVVAINTERGGVRGTVLKVGRFNVDVDLNHPLAGKTLVFDVKVIDVRDATEEEMAHGHVHGPGGAHA